MSYQGWSIFLFDWRDRYLRVVFFYFFGSSWICDVYYFLYFVFGVFYL